LFSDFITSPAVKEVGNYAATPQKGFAQIRKNRLEELEKRIKVLEARQLQTEVRLEGLRNSLMTLEPLLKHLKTYCRKNSPCSFGTTVRQRAMSFEQLIGNFRSNVIAYYHHVDT
jgi:hypothetical protein